MAFDAYVKIEGIPDEALDSQYKDCIEITGYHFGATQPVSRTASSAGGASSGRTIIRDLVLNKLVDQASAKLFLKAAAIEVSGVTQATKRHP
ncbi:type VI secretion system tube protein Hcp [Pseudomonas sp. dw_358]|uniref:type VI secretion system tube protein Hcp n=1 Tax=Pseudomonas sp. dw_358 TaxID=2720083 RepID=UPI001BD6B132|nr:type VI secretion system tube protein Hcp [Pseudomonas sp. dw_358]